MEYTQIAYDVSDKIATITLDRPDKLNAFTGRMMYEIIDAFDRIDADDDVRVVIVTGAGRGFCAGADLSASGGETFSSGGSDIQTEAGVPRDGGGMVSLRIFECTKPVIGAINGASVGVGVTMTLPMDFRLASEHAKFGFVFARRGIVPEACSSYFLPRLVGISQATEWCYTGRVFGADEALAGGLVRSIHAADDLLEPVVIDILAKRSLNSSVVGDVGGSEIFRQVGYPRFEGHFGDHRFVELDHCGLRCCVAVIQLYDMFGRRPAGCANDAPMPLPF